eukprot:6179045-Pleurochrysis_carterae.AAC.1
MSHILSTGRVRSRTAKCTGGVSHDDAMSMVVRLHCKSSAIRSLAMTSASKHLLVATANPLRSHPSEAFGVHDFPPRSPEEKLWPISSKRGPSVLRLARRKYGMELAEVAQLPTSHF